MFLFFIAIALIGPLIHLLISHQPKTLHRIVELYLTYSLFALVGLSALYAFIGHTFAANQVARFIGWPTGSPFQFEVACANLAFGVLGILCIWLRNNFWLATIIGYSTFLWGAAYGHIRDIVEHHNYAPGNAGLVLYLDIFVPILLIVLYVVYRVSSKES